MQGIRGWEKRAENAGMRIEWRVAMRPSLRRGLVPESTEALREKRKASVRAKVEHPFLYVKRHFGYAKVRYRGLYKNTQRLAVLFGLTNLLKAEGYLRGGMRKAVGLQSPIEGNRPFPRADSWGHAALVATPQPFTEARSRACLPAQLTANELFRASLGDHGPPSQSSKTVLSAE